MLAERRNTPTTPVALALLAPLLLSVLLAFAGTSRGDFLGVVTNPDASRTAVWNMNSSAGLSPSGVTFNAGHAELPWVTKNVSWTTPAAFTSNGTLDANATDVAGGIGLLADTSNHVANSGFEQDSNWTYANGTNHGLNATWNATAQDAMFRYVSPANESLWGAMDSLAGWLPTQSTGDTAVASLNTSAKKEGYASAQLNLTFLAGGSHFAGLWNQSLNVDWSKVNRLVLWVYLNESAALSFNVSAINATFVMHFTPPEALVKGWQELTVDLDQLGPASGRSKLVSLTLRINGAGPISRTVLFDDLRIGTAKEFSDVASVQQSVAKVDVTWATAGSAQLGLWWHPSNGTGVAASARVSVTGPGGTYQHSLPTPGLGGAGAIFLADVSSTISLPGAYIVEISVAASVNTTAASNLTVFLDDVSLVFPNRHNGTYLSDPLSLDNDSVFDSVSWSAALPPGTYAELNLRTQMQFPISGQWSPWSSWLSPGTEPLVGLTGVAFQVRVALNTTNASVTPVLEALTVISHHRAPAGTIVAGPWTITALDFRWWRNLTAASVQPAGTAIRFYVGNGTSWSEVTPGATLRYAYTEKTIYWRTDLITNDTLFTPKLFRINLTYEFLGAAVRVTISPAGPVNVSSGHYITFDAYAWDAGDHSVEVAAFNWYTTDPNGLANYNNGTFRAGNPGNYTITANLPWDPTISARVSVRVLAVGGTNTGTTDTPLAGNLWMTTSLLVAGIAAGAFALYEVLIRRLFSIDDVFLISKDGRLMMHNTRRMRADRDEDILSGMLTAIMSFLRDQDPEENGELKQFQVGGKTTLLERGRHAYLAAVYTGRVPRWAAKDLHRFMEDLDAHFGDAFRTWKGAPDDLQDLKAFTLRFARNVRYRRSPIRDRAS